MGAKTDLVAHTLFNMGINVSTTSADGFAASTGAGRFFGGFFTATTANASLIIYDDATTASGKELLRIGIATKGDSKAVEFSVPIQVSNGIFVKPSGGIAAAFYI